MVGLSVAGTPLGGVWQSVKRIAAAPWMGRGDLKFIASLPNLEALDLSAFGEDHSTPRLSWGDVAYQLGKLLPRLKWLGLCLHAIPSPYDPQDDAFTKLLAAC